MRKTPGGVYDYVNIGDFPADVWFVDSNHAGRGVTTGHGTHPDQPFSTFAYAYSSDLMATGDVCFLMPGHAETINSAAEIAADIAGVDVRGLGRGSRRPTFTFDATGTTSTITITAADTRFSNMLMLTSGTIDIANGLAVTGADCVLDDIEWRESAADSQWDDALIISTGAARCKVSRPIMRMHPSGNANEAGILISAAVDGVEIWDANIDGLFATGCIESSAANLNCHIVRPRLHIRHATQDSAVNMHSGTTGHIVDPYIRTATNDAGGFNSAIVAAAMQIHNPSVVNAAGERGGAWGTASTA
jgi:hypothetical protein